MTKISSLNNLICTTLICFTLLHTCSPRNFFYDLDFGSQTLDPQATGFILNGNSVIEGLGFSVSTAGDINNDGYDDIIISALFTNGSQGVVYVIYGGEESSFVDLDLTTTSLNPLTTGFTITGRAGIDNFGYSVSTAGDIDNDGYDDIIIGAPKTGYQGSVYVIYGGPKSSMSNIDLNTQTLNPSTTGFKLTGKAANEYFGLSVSTAGDIDNDGYDDIIIGASWTNNNQGAAYVIYGGTKATRSNWDFNSGATLNPSTTGFKITGNGGSFGVSVSTAGDINNDGYDDIIVGANYKNTNQGAAYVIYGGAKSTMSNIVLSSTTLDPLTTGFIITGKAAQDQLGYSVSTAGDINNDGYDDIIIGAIRASSSQGAAYVIYGGEKSSMSNVALSSTTLNPTSTGFTITGNGGSFGFSVNTAGDINKDGYDDIIIGASGKNDYFGAAYVIYGRAKSSTTDILLSATPLNPLTTGFTMAGGGAYNYFGTTVGTAGDINNDGYDDIIVGAYGKNSQQGAVYVIFASCELNCKQCSSESVCTECKSPYYLYQGDCLASCPDATLVTASTCEDCPAHCDECSSTSVCTECQSSYSMYKSECFASCPDTTFANTATTCQACPTHCDQCSSGSVCTECTSPFVLFNSQCLKSCPKGMFNSDNVCKDCPTGCSSCTSQDSCQVCFEGFTLSNSLCVPPVSGPVEPNPSSSYQEVQDEAIQRISAAARILSSAVCVGRTVAPFAALASKTVQNTRYLNLSVTSDLSEVYQTWDKDIISWEVPNSFSKNEDKFESSPLLFARYDAGSPFLVNFWPTFINIAGGLTIFITFFVLQRLLEKSKHENWVFLVQKLVSGSFSFTLIQAYVCLDDILFYLVLDIRTNPLNSFFSLASLIIAVIFLAFGCLLVFFNLWIVKKYQKTKKQGEKDIQIFNEKNKYWKLFYSDFNDNNLWSQSFFAFLIIRSTLSSLIITAFYDYPLMQTLFLVILDVSIILFLYLKTPFKTFRGKFAQYFYEITTLLVHLSTFSLSLKPSHTGVSFFSTVIIYLNTILIIGAVGFMLFEISKTISAIRTARLKRSQVVPIENQNLTQTVSPLHPSETDGRKRPDWINQDQTFSVGNFSLLPGATPTGDMESPIMKPPSRAQNRRQLKKGSILIIDN